MWKLKPKLALSIVPTVTLPLMMLGYLAYNLLQQQDQQAIERQIADQLNRNQQYFERQLTSTIANAKLLSKNNLVRQYFLLPANDPSRQFQSRALLALFNSYQETFSNYFEIRLVDAHGQERIRLGQQGLPNHLPQIQHLPWFPQLQTLDNNATLQLIERHEDSGDFYLLVAQPVPLTTYSNWESNAQPELGGYLLLSFDLSTIEQQLNQAQIGQYGYLQLRQQDGQRLLGLSHTTEASVDILQQLLNAPEKQLLTLKDSHSEWLGQHQTLLGDRHIVALWPKQEANVITQELTQDILLALLLAMLTTAALIYWSISGLVLRPMQALKTATQAIGEGQKHALQPFIKRRDELGEMARTVQDMSQNLQNSNRQLQHIAYYDTLTGLANRRMFRQYLDKAIAHAAREGNLIALLFIDIDGFKEVNDQAGHKAGDLVLKEVAHRLSQCMRQEDLLTLRSDVDHQSNQWDLSRLGGDEFTALLSIHRQPDAALVGERILQALHTTFHIEQQQFQLGASIGIAIYPADADNSDELLKHADMAMYQAKSSGKNQVSFFDPSMTEEAQLRRQLLADLEQAIEQDQLQLHYQPQIDTRQGYLIGCEALVRWQHPEQGMIPPNRFIPLAEESGLIAPLGEWVLEQACLQAYRWQQQGLPELIMAVNFSTLQFQSQYQVADMVARTLAQTGLAPTLLDVEVTETAMMEASSDSLASLNAILKLGVKISMDDFGTGYSSLAALNHLPLSKLKIDKSFIDRIGQGEQGDAIVKAIIAMAHQIGLQVVAEGVEESAQYAFLQQHGCEMIQGYLISRPLSADDMTRFIRQSEVSPSFV